MFSTLNNSDDDSRMRQVTVYIQPPGDGTKSNEDSGDKVNLDGFAWS